MSIGGFTVGELAQLRARQAITPLYLAVHKPRTVITGTLASVPTWPTDGTGAGSLELSTTSTPLTAEAGMTCYIGSDTRDWLRVRGPLSGATLPVATTSAGALPLTVGQSVTVVEDYRPAVKRLRYVASGSSGTMYVDYDTTYTDQNTDIPPVPIMGPAAIVYADGAQTFSYFGLRSYSLVSDVSGYAWDVVGNTSSDSAPSFSIATAYPDGRWAKLTVTDDSGKSQTTRRLLWKFDTANPPYTAMVVDSVSMTWGGGCMATVRALGAVTKSDIPDGAHVVLFTAQTFAGTANNIGGNWRTAGRNNVVLEGWIVAGSLRQNPYYGYAEFQVVTVDAMLTGQITSPLILSSTTGAASSWLEMQDMTLDKVMTHISRNMSTLMEVCDVYTTGQQTPACDTASALEKAYFEIGGGDQLNLWAMVRQVYSYLLGGTVSADAQMGVWCEQDLNVSGASGAATLLALTDADIRDDLTLSQNMLKKQAHVLLYSLASGSTAIGSTSPDWPVDYGAATYKQSNLIADQTNLNIFSGNYRAQLNNPYPSLTIPFAGPYRISPAPQSVVTLTDANVTYPRPQGFSAKPFIVRKCDLTFSGPGGYMLADAECEGAVTGTPGVTVVMLTPGTPAITAGTTPYSISGSSPAAIIADWHFTAGPEGWSGYPSGSITWDATDGHLAPGYIENATGIKGVEYTGPIDFPWPKRATNMIAEFWLKFVDGTAGDQVTLVVTVYHYQTGAYTLAQIYDWAGNDIWRQCTMIIPDIYSNGEWNIYQISIYNTSNLASPTFRVDDVSILAFTLT